MSRDGLASQKAAAVQPKQQSLRRRSALRGLRQHRRGLTRTLRRPQEDHPLRLR
eukprot:CAMPEP_0206004468 /NCGR_PEP_ID=MMETSP1464-20131121/4001_1 /ASSEMBLY_ACC=CAM_ASM_001124 /TAXON_ID=119497 /ORGANISM="Exanthemachrysis gayraliae, Strain RCC1523" /LENGTH=53 /DNA_ID=CAMNT_0053377883 /DNA_START=205 /DNA_END=362 /DNA_ORIENTATION=-